MKAAKESRARVINEAQETVSASEIKTHPRNPRRGKVEAISESIHANGFYGALVVNRRTKHILAGNHRFLAGKDLGMTSFPVIWVDVDRAEEERILAADNRTSDMGGYDNEALAALLEGLRGTDGGLSGTGYDDADLDALLEGLRPADGDALDAAFGALPSGEKSDFETMSFTLHRDQAAEVREALARAKEQGPFPDTGNANANGNALARIVEVYRGR